MHRVICLHLFFLLFIISGLKDTVQGQAPGIQWQNALGGTSFDQVKSVIYTADGGFAAAGITTSSNGDVTTNYGYGDVWVVKLNSSGSLQWQKSYGGSADEGAQSIRQTADGGFIVAGASTSADGDVTENKGLNDIWILKLDASGNLQWQKSYGGSSVEIAYDIQQTTDLGYIVAGYTISNNGDVSGNHGFEDMWILKLDAAGNLDWQKTFGGTMDERAFSIQQTNDGGYIAAGYTKSTNGDITNYYGNYDWWIVKMHSDGSLQWQKSFGGSQNDQCYSIIPATDGGYIAAGKTASNNGDVTINKGAHDLWVVKMDETGNLQWQKTYGGSGVDQAYEIKAVSSGGYVIAGSSYSLNGDVTGNHGGYDFWVIRIDNAGNLLWQKSLGGSSVEEAYSIAQAGNSGYIVAGGTLSVNGDVTGNHGDFDFWLVKLNETIQPLPVELLNFEGINQHNKNILKWSTASELNNDYFILERNTGNVDFITIDKIYSKGNSSQTQYYSTEDFEIEENTIYYYRLKQVDFDGSYSFSETIPVKTELNNNILIYFDHYDNILHVNSLREQYMIVEISDIYGRTIQKLYEGLINSGNNVFKINTILSPGICFIRTSNERDTHILKIHR
jgi:hypothetical protein